MSAAPPASPPATGSRPQPGPRALVQRAGDRALVATSRARRVRAATPRARSQSARARAATHRARPQRAHATVLALALTAALPGCGSTTTTPGASNRLQVVAAENFWGSLATQLGGGRAEVRSIIVNPETDPHSYEPTAQDAREMAGARMAIVNGIGYDAWASRLLDATPQPGRQVLDVGKLVGLGAGANPHQWYSPAAVSRVIDAISAGYERLDPAQATYYRRQHDLFLSRALARYRGLTAAIAARYAGTPVGASESIFVPMATALRLRLLTPAHLMAAIAEGTDPSASDKATADRQIAARAIAMWVFNRQNVTPDVQRLTSAARSAGIPIVTVTETLSPASASFQNWQSAQLQSLAKALASATHR